MFTISHKKVKKPFVVLRGGEGEELQKYVSNLHYAATLGYEPLLSGHMTVIN